MDKSRWNNPPCLVKKKKNVLKVLEKLCEHEKQFVFYDRFCRHVLRRILVNLISSFAVFFFATKLLDAL